MIVCEDCGEPVKPGTIGTYRELTGWEKVRPTGGANGVVLRRETGKLLCNGCGERRKMDIRRGIIPGQETLL
jgi:hypothetical protein